MKFGFFHAPWCGVCHEKAPVARRLADELGLPFEVVDLEDAEGERLASERRIQTVPTLALIDDERVPFRLVGRMITPENVRHMVAMTRREPRGAP